MGFKFNIATLVPILFGIIAILAKKALVVSKLALVISSAAGLGSLLFGNNLASSANVSITYSILDFLGQIKAHK